MATVLLRYYFFSITISLYYNAIIGTILLLCAYTFVNDVSNAIVIWIYITETCQDVALGTGAILIYTIIIVETATTFSLINFLSLAGFFALYGTFTICSILFTYFYVGETKGLSDKQRKELFIPGAKYGRKLRPNEVYKLT